MLSDLHFEDFLSFASILSYAFNILMAVAINLDCRAKNINARRSYTVLALFFPLIVGIIYAIKRKGAQKAFKICGTCKNKVGAYANKCPHCGGYTLYEYKNPKGKTLSVISIILCVVGSVCFVVSNVISFPDYVKTAKETINDYDTYDEADDTLNNYSSLFYDRNGVAYSDPYDVLYYDRDGNTYNISDGGFINTQTQERYDSKYCFADSDGYFCYIDDGSLEPLADDELSYTDYDENGNEIVINVTYQDSNGNRYYAAEYVNWDYSGNMDIDG